MADALFEVLVVHCFFGCGHVVRGLDPRENHAAMEAHYAARHQAQIGAIIGPDRVTVIPGVYWEFR